jgi:hypothetical protein
VNRVDRVYDCFAAERSLAGARQLLQGSSFPNTGFET